MSDATKALIARARRDHREGPTFDYEPVCISCPEDWPCPTLSLADALEVALDELATWRRAGELCVEILRGGDDDDSENKYSAKVFGREIATPVSWWSEVHDTPIAAVREALAKYDADMAHEADAT